MSNKEEKIAPYSTTYDLSKCDKEPIHIIRLIQAHAALLLTTIDTYQILHASGNTQQVLGTAPLELLGKNLTDFLESSLLEEISTGLAKEYMEDFNPLQVSFFGEFKLEHHQNLIIHRTEQGLLLEFEARHQSTSQYSFLGKVDRSIQKIQQLRNVDQLFDQVAKEIKSLTAYDRVMIYRFDEQKNGEVIAEAKEEWLEAFLNLRYPAADIPSQARALYLRNQIRIIYDTLATPAPIEPALHPQTGEPLDLSLSVARGVSPIHLEYLSNMGVRATMSVAIIVEGQLWGLIACHHHEPKLIDYRLRRLIQFMGKIISGHLALHATNEFRRLNIMTNKVRSQLFEQMGKEWDIVGGLTQNNPSFLDLVQATGGGILLDKQLHLLGDTPSVREIEALIDWLKANHTSAVFSTQQLMNHFPPAKDYAKIAAGLLSIRITASEFVLWFRPEIRQTVNWGGEPNKTFLETKDGPRLSPRKSFEKWQQIVEFTSAPWLNHQIEAAIALRNNIKDFIIQKYEEVKQLNEDLLKAYQNMESFNFTVSHDLRAPLRGIKGFAEILKEDYFDQLDDYGKSVIESIVGSVGKMNAFINDILEFSRFDKTKLLISGLDLPGQIAESWKVIGHAYPDQKEVTLNLQNLPATIYADHRLFRYLLDNLLSNAVKYTRGRPSRTIEVGGKQTADSTQFYIKDNGIGFDMRYADRIFAVFHRLVAEDQYEGNGVGLAIAKKIVKRHQGHIWVESQTGIGTTFYCEFAVPKLLKE